MIRSLLRAALPAISADLQLLLGGSAWLTVAAVLGQGSMLVAGVAVANALGIADYGRFTLLQTTLVLLAGLAQLSFSFVVAQQVSRLRDRDPQAAGRIARLCFLLTFSLGGVLATALIAARFVVSQEVFRDPQLATGLAIIALALPILAFSTVQQGLLNGLERFREQAIAAILLAPLVAVLPFLGAMKAGFFGALCGLAIAFTARFAVNQIILFRVFRAEKLTWSGYASLAEVRTLLGHAAPATLAGLALLAATWGGQMILARTIGSEIELGLFNAATMLRTMVIFVPQQMLLVLLPLLARRSNAEGAADARNLLTVSAKAMTALAIVSSGAMAAIAGPLLSLFGPQFAAGKSILLVLLLSAPLECLTITLYQSLQAQGYFWRVLACVNAPLAAVVLTIAAVLVPAHLALGLAWAWAIGWSAALILTVAAMRVLKIPD